MTSGQVMQATLDVVHMILQQTSIMELAAGNSDNWPDERGK